MLLRAVFSIVWNHRFVDGKVAVRWFEQKPPLIELSQKRPDLRKSVSFTKRFVVCHMQVSKHVLKFLPRHSPGDSLIQYTWLLFPIHSSSWQNGITTQQQHSKEQLHVLCGKLKAMVSFLFMCILQSFQPGD